MYECEQSKGQSVLEHGFSVKNYLFDIIKHLRDGTELKYKWIIPDWVYQNKDMILSSLPDDKTLKLYTVFHDAGKPFCLTMDSNGKRHFPNHANVSYEYFSKIFDNKIASELIRHDMDIHNLRSDGVENFYKNKYALTLLLTGLAEIHSNSTLFGGFESTSFKIKFKSISKNGNRIINKLKNK